MLRKLGLCRLLAYVLENIGKVSGEGVGVVGEVLEVFFVVELVVGKLVVGVVDIVGVCGLGYLGIDIVFKAGEVNKLRRGSAARDAHYGIHELLHRLYLLQLHEETAVGEIVENENQALTFLFNQVDKRSLVHEVDFIIGVGSHILEGYLGLFLPIVIAEKKRVHLTLVVADRVADCIAQLQKCSVGVDADFPAEVVDLIRDYAKVVYHIIADMRESG